LPTGEVSYFSGSFSRHLDQAACTSSSSDLGVTSASVLDLALGLVGGPRRRCRSRPRRDAGSIFVASVDGIGPASGIAPQSTSLISKRSRLLIRRTPVFGSFVAFPWGTT
jgi:hypothetical protein